MAHFICNPSPSLSEHCYANSRLGFWHPPKTILIAAQVMTKHYVFFTRRVLPQADPHLVQIIQCANAAANLGYPAVLAYLRRDWGAMNPIEWAFPMQFKQPDAKLAQFYNLQERLKVLPLAMPYPIDAWKTKLTHSNTIISRYYFPFHLRQQTKIVHTREWNFVKVAIQHGIPAIYERDHYEEKPYEPEIVNHPLFRVGVTVVESVRQNMIRNGMPPEKVIRLHNGINQLFLSRRPEQAAEWRKKLLAPQYQNVVVYSGGLYRFKGVDLLLEVAREMPQTHFVFLGGKTEHVEAYRHLAREQQLSNTSFLGHLPQDQLPALMQAADILAHPHLSGEAANFTSPMKFFDYMGTGTPIVATEISPLMEFKSAGVVAGWCEPDNPIAYARCLQQVLQTHPRKSEGYCNSVEFVRQFTWENRIQQIQQYIAASLHDQSSQKSVLAGDRGGISPATAHSIRPSADLSNGTFSSRY